LHQGLDGNLCGGAEKCTVTKIAYSHTSALLEFLPMLLMKTSCERCHVALPADRAGAMICSFECTFCLSCGQNALARQCPNCKGELQVRPTRATALLDRFPARDVA
jgi:hypothetical protein